MNKELLLVLATHLETAVPEERFNFREIFSGNFKGREDLSCGASACAVGWAITNPVLNAAGINLKGLEGKDQWVVQPELWVRARVAFGLTIWQMEYLFDPASGGMRYSAHAHEVAKHVREFVANNGRIKKDLEE